MSATIPPATPARRDQFIATVVANVPLCREHYRLVLRLSTFPQTEPGQFVQVSCRSLADFPVAGAGAGAASGAGEPGIVEWTAGARVELHDVDLIAPSAMLRRPFSLAGRRDLAAGGGRGSGGGGSSGGSSGGVELDLIHRVVGVGTEWLSRLKVGDAVGLLGPLGNTFGLPSSSAPASSAGSEPMAVLIGGGVGIPPMLYLAGRLAGRRAVAFCGALTRDLLPLTLTGDTNAEAQPAMCIEEFARHGIPSVVTTDDGSFGFRGFVTQALERWLDGREGHAAGGTGRAKNASSPSTASPPSASPLILYTCGPELMMKRVAEIAAARGIECQIAVERAMACGMGTCQSCCIRVRKPDPSQPPLPGSDWCYRLACTDGPVFRGADLLW